MSKKSIEAQSYSNLTDVTLTSVAFRKANNEPYLDTEAHFSVAEVEAHIEARKNAKEILFETFVENPRMPSNEQHWEMQRKAVLAKLGGVSLGSFNNYFLRLPSESQPSEEDDYFYDAGESEIVHTNKQIGRLKETQDNPLFFMEQALAQIEHRSQTRKESVGPENYATSLKFFADKYAGLEDDSHVDQLHVRRLVNESLEGFFKIAEKDAPNPIEMTNIYSAIRILPAETVDANHVAPLLEHTAKLLPDYTPQVAGTFVRAMPKLTLGENGAVAAEILSLTIRKNKQFEKVSDFRDVIRAIAVLPKSLASDRALAAFFEHRNDLESVLDLESADEVMHRFRTIADNVVGTSQLHVYLKGVASTTGKSALARVKDGSREGIYSQAQLKDVHQTLQRIKANYDAI